MSVLFLRCLPLTPPTALLYPPVPPAPAGVELHPSVPTSPIPLSGARTPPARRTRVARRVPASVQAGA